jgi:hypothetical protein
MVHAGGMNMSDICQDDVRPFVSNTLARTYFLDNIVVVCYSSVIRQWPLQHRTI